MSDVQSIKPGRLFVISAPSGAGKTTLVNYLRQRLPELKYSVSYTTRPKRPAEVQGKDYHFIRVAEFERMVAENRWLEWANVHGNYYGTSLNYVKNELAAGNNILLEIDVKGAKQILAKNFECTTIFIMPPSLEILRQRLTARGDESPENIDIRSKNAAEEIAQKDIYQHVIINDDLETAKQELYKLVAGIIYAQP